ncbi:FecR domain-containing protein [Variovorax sp. UMC13]|uniref:FecR domain-containing protein n=1 Tax=Variovorax sp. UMC13 TaxID=1862326 RepID=UPI00160083D0|nr:FecR domain-containing protein [Variovorax sp. UMC13]MBB1599841.1 hypothetical protein [Variovorax sp. UMC13]
MTPARRPRRRALAVLWAGALAMAGSLQAVAAPHGDLRLLVRPGDTLQSLGERHLRSPSRWRELQAINHLGAHDALEAGSVLRIPRAWLRPASLATARVEFVQGDALGIAPPEAPAAKARPAAEPASPLATGDAVTEGTQIQVPTDGFLRLRLADGSVVRVLADSDVELKRLRSKRHTGSYESVIEVHRGKVESEVAPQPKGRLFEIHAPGAVASVRGTRFAVAVSPEGRVSTAVTTGVVKMRPRTHGAPMADLLAGEGAVLEASGAFHKRPALPPPPDPSTLPDLLQDAERLVFQLPTPTGTVAGYEVRIARPERLSEVLRNGVFEGGRVQFPALEDGDYRMSVRAIDREGLTGPKIGHPFRIQARPVPPGYRAPAPGARLTAEAGRLVCAATAEAQAVRLQLAATADFARPLRDERLTGSCDADLAALAPGAYWWRVATLARDGAGAEHQGPFAAPQPFTVVPTPTIADLRLDDRREQPTLHWRAEPGQTFRAQLARDPGFGAPLLDLELATSHWTISGPARGNYHVRLQARDASGLAGPFTAARTVHIGPVVDTAGGEVLRTGDGSPVERP